MQPYPRLFSFCDGFSPCLQLWPFRIGINTLAFRCDRMSSRRCNNVFLLAEKVQLASVPLQIQWLALIASTTGMHITFHATYTECLIVIAIASSGTM